MDFSNLPDPAFLKIVHYLPLEECVRVGRVDKSFRRFSQLAISKTKSLDLDEIRFRNLTGVQLAVILDLCAPNLEKIEFPNGKFGDTDEAELRIQELASTLAIYECPRLTDLNLVGAPIDYTVFDRLIRNNPNMESLQWSEDFVGFPDVTNNYLKKLELNISDDDVLQSLTGRCPNLKEVYLELIDITSNVLDQFLASSPHIERMYLVFVHDDIIIEDLVNLWNLPLTSFEIDTYEEGNTPGDEVLYKVAESFPRLKWLRLDDTSGAATNDGIGALAALQELEDLDLFLSVSKNNDDGIRVLSGCKQLRKLNVYRSVISGNTLVTLIRGLPKLREISIRAIDEADVPNPEEAAVILECLSGIGKRDIKIALEIYGDQLMEALLKSIWDTKAVNDVIKKLEDNEGLKVRIVWR